MQLLTDLLTYALIGVFAQNIIFTGGAGAERAIRAAQHGRRMLPCAGLIALFSLAGVGAMALIRLAAAHVPWLSSIQIILYLAALSVLYLLLVFITGLGRTPWLAAVREMLPECAFNSMIMLLGTGRWQRMLSPGQTVGFAVGCAGGYLLASLLLREATRRIGNPEMNRCFLGLPAVLIYLGILAMAFAGFTGGVSLFY